MYFVNNKKYFLYFLFDKKYILYYYIVVWNI